MPTCPKCEHHWTTAPKAKRNTGPAFTIVGMGEVFSGQLCQGCNAPVPPGPCVAAESFPAIWCMDCSMLAVTAGVITVVLPAEFTSSQVYGSTTKDQPDRWPSQRILSTAI
jgi:hypothetical protein